MGLMEKLTAGAGNPGLFALDKAKLKALRPQLFGLWATLNGSAVDNPKVIEVELNDGDIQPAVVMSIDPLLVACYSDEFDAVVLLGFPAQLAAQYNLQPGSRLLTVNSYTSAFSQKDIVPGPKASGRWRGIGPTVADFFTSDNERLALKKQEFTEAEWAYVEELGRRYMAARPGMARHGLKYRFRNPEPVEKMKFNNKAEIG